MAPGLSGPVSWGQELHCSIEIIGNNPVIKLLFKCPGHIKLMKRNRITSLDLAINSMTSHDSCQSPVTVFVLVVFKFGEERRK